MLTCSSFDTDLWWIESSTCVWFEGDILRTRKLFRSRIFHWDKTLKLLMADAANYTHYNLYIRNLNIINLCSWTMFFFEFYFAYLAKPMRNYWISECEQQWSKIIIGWIWKIIFVKFHWNQIRDSFGCHRICHSLIWLLSEWAAAAVCSTLA